MLELSVNMLGFVWFEGDTVAAVHRHPQDRRTISLAGTSCMSGVVSGRNAASMAQRAICASSKPSDDLSSSLFLRFDFEWSNFATAITDGGILKAIVNSVIITVCSTVITCLVGAAAAYPLARRQTRGNKLVSAGILAIMMIPPLSILVPLYFDQDPDVVLDLVGRAARLGVERFVLDDGWFHARRTDTAGLGDWWVDRSVWPDGLKPLADAVHAHGMEFGLWFEPEIVNPDSDLYREHPDWVLQATGRLLPPPGHAARALPEHPVGILRVGRRTHRSGRHRARRARLDLGHDRCPVPPTYPTVACGCASPGWTRRRTTG